MGDSIRQRWPNVSYGTRRRGVVDPDENVHSHEDYQEPAYAWLPSIGVSHLVQVEGDEFPAWRDDLLIASLNGSSLFRTRVRLGRIVYSERIPVGETLRDLLVDADGRILALTEDSDIVAIENAGRERTGEAVFSGCATCHEAGRDSPATAPDLRGLIGREAGAIPEYPYSEALDAAEFEWEPDTLDRFLADPSGFLPGNTMPAERLTEADRRAVIDFLHGYD